MIVEETFYRPSEIQRESRCLPADTYNMARLLLGRCGSGCLFVPIRSMQYLAVLDAEEFIFVDREGGRLIDIAWQRFKPQSRHSLDEAVAYEAVYYTGKGEETMRRLQSEFYKALHQLQEKSPLDSLARVIKLDRDHY